MKQLANRQVAIPSEEFAVPMGGAISNRSFISSDKSPQVTMNGQFPNRSF